MDHEDANEVVLTTTEIGPGASDGPGKSGFRVLPAILESTPEWETTTGDGAGTSSWEATRRG